MSVIKIDNISFNCSAFEGVTFDEFVDTYKGQFKYTPIKKAYDTIQNHIAPKKRLKRGKTKTTANKT